MHYNFPIVTYFIFLPLLLIRINILEKIMCTQLHFMYKRINKSSKNLCKEICGSVYHNSFLEKRLLKNLFISTLETRIVSFRYLTLISEFKIFYGRYQIKCDTIRLHNTYTEGYVVWVCLEKNNRKKKCRISRLWFKCIKGDWVSDWSRLRDGISLAMLFCEVHDSWLNFSSSCIMRLNLNWRSQWIFPLFWWNTQNSTRLFCNLLHYFFCINNIFS